VLNTANRNVITCGGKITFGGRITKPGGKITPAIFPARFAIFPANVIFPAHVIMFLLAVFNTSKSGLAVLLKDYQLLDIKVQKR